MLKYIIQEKVNEKLKQGIHWRRPNAYIYYNTEQEAKNTEEDYIKDREKSKQTLTEEEKKTWVDILEYRILTKEVPNKQTFEGIVKLNENGTGHTVLVNGLNIDELLEQDYKGNRVKITIELI